MKAENRVGIFDLFVIDDELIGPRAHIWLVKRSAV